MRRLVALALVVAYASGCVAASYKVSSADTRRSQVVFGGLMGDVALGALASRAHGELNDDSGDTTSYFWIDVGALLLLDIVAVTTVYLSRSRAP